MLRTTVLGLAVIALAIACGSATGTPPATSVVPGASAVASSLAAPTAGASAAATGASPAIGSAQAAPSVDAAAVAAAQQHIHAANFSDPASLDAIGQQLRFTATGEAAARGMLETASTLETKTLWTALWVYASTGTDPAPLAPLLEHSDASIRALAAAQSIALGNQEGFAALKALLSEEGQLLGSNPPLTINSYSAAALTRYITAPGTPAEPQTDEELTVVPAAWAAWLDQNGAALVYDRATGTWTTS